jgi:hypothetical protein
MYMAVLCGVGGRLTSQNGDFWSGQETATKHHPNIERVIEACAEQVDEGSPLVQPYSRHIGY